MRAEGRIGKKMCVQTCVLLSFESKSKKRTADKEASNS